MADQSRSVELLWGGPGRPSRGPKPGLSLDGIVRAAIAIADADGLAAVSMQRVAGEFGFTTMSLYRYVPGKSELIDLMIDTAVGEPPDLSAIPGGWRLRLAEWARLTWQVFLRHPWFLPAAMNRVMGPNQIGWLESAVAAMTGSGLHGEELLGAVMVVNGYVRSIVPLASDPTGPSANSASELGEFILDMIKRHGERFPALTKAIADGAFGPSQYDDLEFGLQRVLDGIEVYVERRSNRRRR